MIPFYPCRILVVRMVAVQCWIRTVHSGCYLRPPSLRRSYFRYSISSGYSTGSNLAVAVGKGQNDRIDPFEECWKASASSINPSSDASIDKILQSINSPAPQSFYVIQRAVNLPIGHSSIEQVLQECSYLLKPGRKFVFQETAQPATTDVTAGVHWNIIPKFDDPLEGWKEIPEASKSPSASRLTNEALELVVEASEAQVPLDERKLQSAIASVKRRLDLTLGTDIRGRSSADTAFSLSLVGVQDVFLFETLVKIARLELERIGRRPSRRSKDILHIVEKLAASGVRGEQAHRVYQLAAESLAMKQQHSDVAEVLSSPGMFDFLSPRPLLWLWRYSSRLKKPKVHLQQQQSTKNTRREWRNNSTEWVRRLKNPTRPLVVDVGSGLGVSLLGLASLTESFGKTCFDGLDFSDCNYLGGDLSDATLRYGNGIAERWNLTDRLQFTHASAEDLLDQITYLYQGRVPLVLLQFPTPYRLKSKLFGNTQLATGPDSSEFMVSEAVLGRMAKLLEHSEGYLLLQTNCEDVAVTLRNRARDLGFECLAAENPVTSPPGDIRLPERTVEWIRLGGERALGMEWSADPLLPPRCATETEVACQVQGTAPIHRCLFKMKKQTKG